MDQKDGGPAFPVVGIDQRGGQQFLGVFNGGMTLRDYFAAQALPAIVADYIAESRRTGLSIASALGGAGHDSYIAADAMLNTREKKP